MKKTVEYEVLGMTCAGCQRSVQSALRRVGVEVSLEDISLAEGFVRIDASVPDATVRESIEGAGYDVGARISREHS
jgi:copper chaperone CopZ